MVSTILDVTQKMQTTALTIFSTSLLVFYICNRCEGLNLCHIKCLNCYFNCDHGTYIDFCGREVCARGPGQPCGGKYEIGGKCDDGLSCRCGRCFGCSLRTGSCTDHENYICHD